MKWVEKNTLNFKLIFFHRYDDDLDEVEEEDHFEDVDDLEVKTTAFTLWMNRTRSLPSDYNFLPANFL